MPETTPPATPIAWIERLPTRQEIEEHRARGGHWLALIPTPTPLPTQGMSPEKGWLHPRLSIVSFSDTRRGVRLRGIDLDTQELPESSLGTAAAADHPRGAIRFAPVVLDEAFTPQPAPVE